jgi:N-acetylglucosaminyldiphosphoundecaprenol N-acetyl-beta-D-mannosaminyltransferase
MLNWSASTDDATAGDRVVVNAPSRAALLADIEARLAGGRGFSVATLNLDHVVKLRRDPAFRRAYARMSHVTADGNPIVWLSRLAGQPLELTPGSELVEPVAAAAARHGAPVAFLGSTDEALERTGAALVSRHPGLVVAARIAPAMGFDPEGPEADAAIETIGASGARICLVALGAPKQEIFAARAAVRLPEVGFLSIGAGLDFIAGTQTRAPGFVRAVSAEWLWRLGTNPRRLARRYALCLAILPGLAREAVAVRGSRA